MPTLRAEALPAAPRLLRRGWSCVVALNSALWAKGLEGPFADGNAATFPELA